MSASFVRTGLLYLRSLKLQVEINQESLNIQVIHHEQGDPVAHCIVSCDGCVEPELITDAQGQAQFSIPSDTDIDSITLSANAPGFNPQVWENR